MCSELFRDLNERKVFGVYPCNARGGEHARRIFESFPDFYWLGLANNPTEEELEIPF